MDYEFIRTLIEENRSKINFAAFGAGVPLEWIQKAESKLGVKFPPSYIWWLENFKGGEISGNEIFSVYNPEYAEIPGGDVVYMNTLNRSKGFFGIDQLLIQKNDLGETYYVDLSQIDGKGESPIYIDPGCLKFADNFLDFLRKKILE